uniref:Peptidylprolyl isomerase n=1 Tax=Minutocellus polymorphus TaxID=265543 RepID=A0A7S0AXB4_9STRA|mmetsp:Transcript_6456/g.10777  ORF Transcript_6456/g.10777 Transcript_6456/m.10777 type:complete len:171 (+) Transcript_6456:132-644(+)
MKTSALSIALAAVACVPSSLAFAPASSASSRQAVGTQRNMFSGAGEAAPKEDGDPEEAKQMEDMAAAMGMSVQEYQLGVGARVRMEGQLDEMRITGGDAAKGVTVEKDGNTPAKHLVITVTEEGKALGKAELEKELVAALKSSGEEAAKSRGKAQQDMMAYIGEEMKKFG